MKQERAECDPFSESGWHMTDADLVAKKLVKRPWTSRRISSPTIGLADRGRITNSLISYARRDGSTNHSAQHCGRWPDSETSSFTAYASVDLAIVRDVVEHRLDDLLVFVSVIRKRLPLPQE